MGTAAKLTIAAETWPLRSAFRISRGVKRDTHVVVVEIDAGDALGRGECVPYPRYGESVESVLASLEAVREALEAGAGRPALQALLPAGAARNAADCALWDLEAKRTGKRAWELAGLSEPKNIITAYTLSLDTPAAMGRAAAAVCERPLLKLKVTGEGDGERVRAVHRAAPKARLIVDANEAWTPDMLAPQAAELAACGVQLIEQPLPAGADGALAEVQLPIPVCADESCHTAADVAGLADRYDVVNIKLDKTGGLTEALAALRAAAAADLGVMVGCMVGTSLSMAPATLLAGAAGFVDIDGPLLLAKDRDPALVYEGSAVSPPDPTLWG